MLRMSDAFAKPFLKWAGGKTQILDDIDSCLPAGLKNGMIFEYFEPFVGGGAVFFYISRKYPIKKAFLYDINPELILTYRVVKKDVCSLIMHLKEYYEKYMGMNEDRRKTFFYETRSSFNHQRTLINFKRYSEDWIKRAAELIFLNKTCYNGLFRVNARGEFNVPFGRYKNPSILDEDNLKAASKLLKKAFFKAADFEEIKDIVSKNSFVYFDPPYRPISKTASFTSYQASNFDDNQQIRLAKLFRELDRKGVKLMLSNSDPKNENPNDDFFDNLYKNFNIRRVYASRIINCEATGRGKIHELIITNY